MKRFIEVIILVTALLVSIPSALAQNPPENSTQASPLAPRGAQGAPAGGRGGRGGRGGGPPAMLQISTDPGPAAEMVKAALDAFNRRDLD
ncbi:MAG TPA: hypothetical protein VFO86_15755, partial [Terriglobia bacterium]|nr:hypothetical protein [Terriglobia bacterium]